MRISAVVAAAARIPPLLTFTFFQNELLAYLFSLPKTIFHGSSSRNPILFLFLASRELKRLLVVAKLHGCWVRIADLLSELCMQPLIPPWKDLGRLPCKRSYFWYRWSLKASPLQKKIATSSIQQRRSITCHQHFGRLSVSDPYWVLAGSKNIMTSYARKTVDEKPSKNKTFNVSAALSKNVLLYMQLFVLKSVFHLSVLPEWGEIAKARSRNSLHDALFFCFLLLAFNCFSFRFFFWSLPEKVGEEEELRATSLSLPSRGLFRSSLTGDQGTKCSYIYTELFLGPHEKKIQLKPKRKPNYLGEPNNRTEGKGNKFVNLRIVLKQVNSGFLRWHFTPGIADFWGLVVWLVVYKLNVSSCFPISASFALVISNKSMHVVVVRRICLVATSTSLKKLHI